MDVSTCDSYLDTRNRVLALINSDRAERDLRRYLNRSGGKDFETLLDHGSPDFFTEADFRAVRKLSVSALHSAREWLCGVGRSTVTELLAQIPSDRDIWDIQSDEYDDILGPESPASRLWHIIYILQAGSGHAGRGVTAGKLLHGKRPRLIPIFDSRARKKLQVRSQHFWEAMYCVLNDPGVRDGLRKIQEQVTEASHLSLLRVLDIIIWTSEEEVLGSPKQGTLMIRDVPSALHGVERVLIEQSLEAAQTLMNANDYSQLAVVAGTGELRGAASWRSIAQARFATMEPTLRDATFDCRIVHPDDGLLEQIDTIYRDEFLLVTDEHGMLRGIVTAADLAYQFRNLTGAFFQISDIEGCLRRCINRSFTAAELQTAVKQESADDMTFGQYMRLLNNADNWTKMHWPQVDQATFIDYLDRARIVRNKVMHSGGELSQQEKRDLQQLFNLLQILDPRR